MLTVVKNVNIALQRAIKASCPARDCNRRCAKQCVMWENVYRLDSNGDGSVTSLPWVCDFWIFVSTGAHPNALGQHAANRRAIMHARCAMQQRPKPPILIATPIACPAHLVSEQGIAFPFTVNWTVIITAVAAIARPSWCKAPQPATLAHWEKLLAKLPVELLFSREVGEY